MERDRVAALSEKQQGEGIGATVHSHNVPAEYLGLLNILELTQPGRANPHSQRPIL